MEDNGVGVILKYLNNDLLVALLVAIVGSYVVYRLGLRAYFIQREHELVRTRYLEGGVDLLTSQLELTLAVFRSNWTLSLNHLKMLRDVGAQVDATVPLPSFAQVPPDSFQIVPQVRISTLVGSKVFWEASQELFAFVWTKQGYFERDLGFGFKMVHDKKLSGSDLWDKMGQETMGLNVAADKFYEILHCLQILAGILESENFRPKDLDKFREHEAVQEVVGRLRKTFPEPGGRMKK